MRKWGNEKMRKIVVLVILGALVALVVMVGRRDPSPPEPQVADPAVEDGSQRTGTASPVTADRPPAGRDVLGAPQSAEDASTSETADVEPLTEDEKREAAEEKLVNAFDDLTDKWMEPSKKAMTMADVDSFAKTFRGVPKERQDECIHRALNLIPDENVMLLAGVLMDKSMDKEIVETVYNDILNRDEDVKKPILRQIFKDKSHPCWADTAWILDVTGELPGAK